jgi:hypothetical protein
MPIPRANDLASDVCLVVHSSIVDRRSRESNWWQRAHRCSASVLRTSYGRVMFRAAPADRFAQLPRPKSRRRCLSSRSLSPAGSIEVSFASGVIVLHAPTPHTIAPRRTARSLVPATATRRQKRRKTPEYQRFHESTKQNPVEYHLCT